MKPSVWVRPAVAAALGALGLFSPARLFAAVSPPAVVTVPVSLSSAEAVRAAYLAFVRDSIVPAQPPVIGAAALRVLATGPVVALPGNFGSDVTADADWLAAQAGDIASPWPVVDAMARAAGIVHLALVTPDRRQGMRALGSGDPLSSPGFSLFTSRDGRQVVCDVVAGASAETSGLRPGDVLEEVDGRPAIRADTFFLIQRPAGTEVPLKINRGSASISLRLQLIKTDVSPVEARLLDDGNAYLRVRWFARSTNPARDTAALFRHELQALLDRGARGLVLDLRSALGGSGEVAMASALCDGEVIFSIVKPLGTPVRPVLRSGARFWPDRPIVILQNRNTTSAGEALTLALRELGHARVVGEESGGGLTEFDFVPLGGGNGVIIPRGMVVGPVSGQCPAGYAISPDLAVSNPEIDEMVSGRDRQLEAAQALLGAK